MILLAEQHGSIPMCGICGKYSETGVRSNEIERMMETLAHRGPDEDGIYLQENIGLGSRRLSIIDLEEGRMPISNEDETIWIVFNGEIYNHQGLRRDLQKNGHHFRTRTDTEVIVHLYEEMGERCVERLSGMFAFAIWDTRAKKLVLARDRIGQKPLFYTEENGEFLFASESKALLAVRKQEPEPNLVSLHHYLSLRFIPPPETMVQGIKKLPPAHMLVFQDGHTRVFRYWQLSFLKKIHLSETEAIDLLREKLREAIESHLVSDVPLGAFLSGGLDSSMIVAMLAQDIGRRVKTFAIGTEASDFDEVPYARLVAERHQTDHVEQYVKPDVIHLLPEMIWHLDEPSDPIAACQYHAAGLASRYVKVVLGGDGGDELFAGFDRYPGVRYADYYALLPPPIRNYVLGPLLDKVPDSFTYKSITQKLRWLNHLSHLPGIAERYAEATCFFRFTHEEKKNLYGNRLWKELKEIDSTEVITSPFQSDHADDLYDRMLYADFVTRLPEHSLMLSDRMSMAHSLELRSPYLDHELVETLASFPSHLKIRHRRLKYILRELSRDYLPPQISRRSKQGFMFPVAYWFRGELYLFLKRFLQDSYLVQEGLFSKERILRLIEEHRNSRVDHHVRLWMVLNLEIWYRIFIAKQSSDKIEERIDTCLKPVYPVPQSI